MSTSEFIDAVKSGGKWDYRRHGRDEYEDFSNWHFGVVVRAWTAHARELGLSQSAIDDLLLEAAQRGAGYYQKRMGTTQTDWGSFLGRFPYGDDPKDAAHIMSGWEMEQLLEEPEGDIDRGGISLP